MIENNQTNELVQEKQAVGRFELKKLDTKMFIILLSATCAGLLLAASLWGGWLFMGFLPLELYSFINVALIFLFIGFIPFFTFHFFKQRKGVYLIVWAAMSGAAAIFVLVFGVLNFTWDVRWMIDVNAWGYWGDYWGGSVGTGNFLRLIGRFLSHLVVSAIFVLYIIITVKYFKNKKTKSLKTDILFQPTVDEEQHAK